MRFLKIEKKSYSFFLYIFQNFLISSILFLSGNAIFQLTNTESMPVLYVYNTAHKHTILVHKLTNTAV